MLSENEFHSWTHPQPSETCQQYSCMLHWSHGLTTFISTIHLLTYPFPTKMILANNFWTPFPYWERYQKSDEKKGISIDGVHPKTSPFSTRHPIWVNYKVVSQLSQPILLLCSCLNSARHNLVIELCRALKIF